MRPLLCALLALWPGIVWAVESGQDTCVVNGAVHADCRGGPPAATGSLMCLEGRDGGQTLQGGTGAGEDLILESTSHATKGEVVVGQAQTLPLLVVDEATGRVGLAKAATDLEGALDLYLGGRCDNGDPCSDDSECTGTCNDALPVMILRNSGEIVSGGIILTFIADPTTGLSGHTKRLADIRATQTSTPPGILQSILSFYTNEGDQLSEHMRIGSKGNVGINGSTKSMIVPTGTLMLRDGSLTSTEPVLIDFYDAQCTDNDISVQVEVECTDFDSGEEDCDYAVRVVEAGGTLDARFRIDADGGITLGSINTNTITLTTDGTAPGEIAMTPLATPSINEAVQVDSTGGLLRDGKVAVNAAGADHDVPVYDSASGDYEDCNLSADFDISAPPSCQVSLDPAVSKFGTCLGDVSTEFCFQTDLGNREVDMGTVQRWEQPHATDDGCDADSDCNAGFSCKSGTCGSAATSGEGLLCDVDADCTGGGAGVCEGNRCEPTALGVTHNQTTENVVAVGVGTRAERYVPGPFRSRIGGTELNNNFFYSGEGGCSDDQSPCDEDADCGASNTCGCADADVCRGGLCSGTDGSGTCELQPNSYALTHFTNLFEGTSEPYVFAIDVYDLNITAGTITVARAATPEDARFGQAALFYVTNNAFIDEENGDVFFDFAEIGGRPAYKTAASSCANDQAGKLGGSTRRASTGAQAPPGATCTDGNNGEPSRLMSTDFRYGQPVLVMGAGGGMIPGTNQNLVVALEEYGGFVLAGGAGGSAGSCPTTGCTGTPGDGGYGGGALYIEVGNEFRCDDNSESTDDDEFDFSGESPTADEGGAGGGAGGLSVYARRQGAFTCDILNDGGAGDAAPGTCCDGGDGGDGANYIVEVPM